jgi:hypothetical protein
MLMICLPSLAPIRCLLSHKVDYSLGFVARNQLNSLTTAMPSSCGWYHHSLHRRYDHNPVYIVMDCEVRETKGCDATPNEISSTAVLDGCRMVNCVTELFADLASHQQQWFDALPQLDELVELVRCGCEKEQDGFK